MTNFNPIIEMSWLFFFIILLWTCCCVLGSACCYGSKFHLLTDSLTPDSKILLWKKEFKSEYIDHHHHHHHHFCCFLDKLECAYILFEILVCATFVFQRTVWNAGCCGLLLQMPEVYTLHITHCFVAKRMLASTSHTWWCQR